MKKLLIIAGILFLTGIQNTFAHALWIEVNPTAAKGSTQEVKVFFGEYSSQKPDSTKKWFSNMRDFQLVLIAPDGTRKTLSTIAEPIFFKGSFVAEQNGVYTLSVIHEVKDTYNNAKLIYNSIAQVNVGGASAYPKLTNVGNLYFQRTENKSKFAGILMFNGKPVANSEVNIVLPDMQKLDMNTAADGAFAFKPAVAGPYFIESLFEEKQSGTHNGRNYEKIWNVITTFLSY